MCHDLGSAVAHAVGRYGGNAVHDPVEQRHRLSDRLAAGRAAGGDPPWRHHARCHLQRDSGRGDQLPALDSLRDHDRGAIPRHPPGDGQLHWHKIGHLPWSSAALPLHRRMVESSLAEVDHGIIEAAQSMGSTNRQIIFKVLLPEALPSLVNGAAISITTILGYTALASTIGGGGLGTLAIVKGLNIRKYDMMYSASLMLVFLVQIITVFGTRTTRSLDHKHR